MIQVTASPNAGVSGGAAVRLERIVRLRSECDHSHVPLKITLLSPLPQNGLLGPSVCSAT
ncbi:MAG: hypothetical protein ABTQ25_17575 [Nitrosomonas ureae]